MGKISQKKENKKSVTLAAISGAVNDGVSKTEQAIKEHLVAFSGNDYENGNTCAHASSWRYHYNAYT